MSNTDEKPYLDNAWQTHEALEQGFKLANDVIPQGIDDPDIMSEALVGLTFNNPRLFAQMLMEHLRHPLEVDQGSGLLEGEKLYWAEAAFHMGPDWIDKLRKVVAFMDRVEGFK